MTQLERNALGRVAKPPEWVLAIYDGLKFRPDTVARRELEMLCESHERLRMELEGATAMLESLGAFQKPPEATR